MEIPVSPSQEPSPKFCNISIQVSPTRRNVKTQVLPKTRCKGECQSMTQLWYLPLVLSCFLNPEVQVNFKPIVQNVGVQVDLLQLLERAPSTEDGPSTADASSTADACVQCDVIEYAVFESTPRMDNYSTSESSFSDAAPSTDTSTGTYHPSGDIQSSLSYVYACIQSLSYSLIIPSYSDNVFLQIWWKTGFN